VHYLGAFVHCGVNDGQLPLEKQEIVYGWKVVVT